MEKRERQEAFIRRVLSRKEFLKLGGTGLAGATLLGAAGCGGGAGQQDEGNGNGEQGGENVTLRFANIFEASQPVNDCGTKAVIKQVAERSGGSLTVENFPASQLGDEKELVESVFTGNLDMAIASSGLLASYHPPLSVIDAAYLFKDFDGVLEVINGKIGQELFGSFLEESGMRVLSTWYNGTRHLTTKNTEVRSPEDLAGLNVRAPDAPIYIANVEALGASPTPLAFEEVYLALQQGAIDGQENPVSIILSNKFNEVQNYLMLTAHQVQTVNIIISDKIWQSLSGEQQKALQGSLDFAADEVRRCITEDEETTLEELLGGQMQVIDDIDVEAFRKRAQKTLPEKFSDDWSEDLYQRVQEAS